MLGIRDEMVWTGRIHAWHGMRHGHQLRRGGHHDNKQHGQHRQPRHELMWTLYTEHGQSRKQRNGFAILHILSIREAECVPQRDTMSRTSVALTADGMGCQFYEGF